MKMWAGSWGYLVVIIFNVLCMAFNSALTMVCNPMSLLDICISNLVGLYIL